MQYAGASVSTRQWLLADERGSIVAVTDWSGASIQINSYDEYGAPAPGNAGRFGYTGQVWLPETGLYHYKNRAYNPELGRFMQTDPIGVSGGMNLYAYVGGDPVNFGDPLGLARVCATPTGTRIQRCVYVDGNGDGDSSDDDLGRRLVNWFERAFRSFIIANSGADLSSFGKPVSGFGEANNYVRAISQFAGYAAYRAGGDVWASWQLISEFVGAGISNGRASTYSDLTAGYFGKSLISKDWVARSGPTNLARTLLHEALHLRRGYGLASQGVYFRGYIGDLDPRHGYIDHLAQYITFSSGLGLPDAGRWGTYRDADMGGQCIGIPGSIGGRGRLAC